MFTKLDADNRVFLPLSINKKLWAHSSTMIFLNEVYCEQLDETEKYNLHYNICNSRLPVKDQAFQNSIKEIAACIGHVVNVHSNVCEDREYWEKLFFRWLLYIVYDIQVKILQFEELKKTYPDQIFYTYTKKVLAAKDFFEGGVESLWEDDYHLWLYTYLAKNYFEIQVEPIEGEEQIVAATEQVEQNKSTIQSICCKIKHAFTESPRQTLRRGISYYYRTFSCSKTEVMYYCLDISGDTSTNWIIGSSGKIQPIYCPSEPINVLRSSKLRAELTSALRTLDAVSPIVADVIGRTFPRLYLEEYKYHHANSISLLKKYRRLKVIFSMTGILSPCSETIFSFLAQSRGVKIISLQHGGDYEVINGIVDQEEYLSDIFYSWSGEEVRPRSSACKILSAPSYKFHYYQNMQCSERYILFVGTTLFMYPRYDEYVGEDVYKKRYIERQLSFFSSLKKSVRKNLYIKEYYVDSGWHIVSMIARAFPMLRFLGVEQTAMTYGAVNILDRNISFAEALAGCKLMICDHLSTTWREALYLNKPFIMLLDRETWSFREEALESVHLMESVDIVIYAPEEAASLLNRIYEDVLGWWNQPERQKVIRKIRENFLFEVEDIDDWWMHELLRQSRS